MLTSATVIRSLLPPLLSRESIGVLDEYVRSHLTSDTYACIKASYGWVRQLFPGKRVSEIGHLLGIYADYRRPYYHVVRINSSGGKLDFSEYAPGDARDMPRIFYYDDLGVVGSYLETMLAKHSSVILDAHAVEGAGYVMKTSRRYRYIVMNLYLSLHPEYVVTWRSMHKNQWRVRVTRAERLLSREFFGGNCVYDTRLTCQELTGCSGCMIPVNAGAVSEDAYMGVTAHGVIA